MSIQQELSQLILQDSPQIEVLRSRAISGNNQILYSFCNVINKFIQDLNKHFYAYKQINQLLMSARPEIVNYVYNNLMDEVVKNHCKKQLNQYIILWGRMMPGTSKDYPNFNKKLESLKLNNPEIELSNKFSRYKFQFSKNAYAILDQRVQFFEDSYRTSLETKKFNSALRGVQSFASEQVSSELIEKQMNKIQKIRNDVENGPVKQQNALQYLKMIKRFLSYKPKTLKKTLSLNFNDDRLWAQQFAQNYSSYLQNGSLHLYKHFSKDDDAVIQNKEIDGSYYNSAQRPFIVTIGNRPQLQTYRKQHTKKQKSQRLINPNESSRKQLDVLKYSSKKQQQTANFILNQNSNNKSFPNQRMSDPTINIPNIPNVYGIQSTERKPIYSKTQNYTPSNYQQNNYKTDFHDYFTNHASFGIQNKQPRFATTQRTDNKNMEGSNSKKKYFNFCHQTPKQQQFNQVNDNAINWSPNFKSDYTSSQVSKYSRGLKKLPLNSKTQQYQLNQIYNQRNQGRNNTQRYNNYQPMINNQDFKDPIQSAYYSQTTPYNFQKFGQQIFQTQGVESIQRKKGKGNLFSSRSEQNLFGAWTKPKIFDSSKRSQNNTNRGYGLQQKLFIKKYGKNQTQNQNFSNTQRIQNQMFANSQYGYPKPHRNNTNSYRNMNHHFNNQQYSDNLTSYDGKQYNAKYNPNRYTFLSDFSPRSLDRNYKGRNLSSGGTQNFQLDRYIQKDHNQNAKGDTGMINRYQLINQTVRFTKFSQLNEQKNRRRLGIRQQQLKPIQNYILMPYINNFKQPSKFNRFRKNCLLNDFCLYKSKCLEIYCKILTVSESMIKVEICYKNVDNHPIYIQTLYRVPKCMKVHKQNTIKKRSVISASTANKHIFGLKLVSFPLQPCYLDLKYMHNQIQNNSNYENAPSYRNGSPQVVGMLITMPITMRNYFNYMVLNAYEWQQKWEDWATNQNYQIFRNIVLDSHVFHDQQLKQLSTLRQLTELNPKQGYSVKQLGAYCSQPNVNKLSFLLRISQRFNNIVTIELLCNKRIVNQDQRDYLLYCLNIWCMLLGKIQHNFIQ